MLYHSVVCKYESRSKLELAGGYHCDGIRRGVERCGNCVCANHGQFACGSLVADEVGACAGGAVAASIFVNSLQFALHEDFVTYPRTIERDCELLAGAAGAGGRANDIGIGWRETRWRGLSHRAGHWITSRFVGVEIWEGRSQPRRKRCWCWERRGLAVSG
jgi:hypothetical protein